MTTLSRPPRAANPSSTTTKDTDSSTTTTRTYNSSRSAPRLQCPPALAPYLSQEDTRDRGLMAIISALASVNNQALCVKELVDVVRERVPGMSLGGATPTGTLNSAIRNHTNRCNERKTPCLLTRHVLSGTPSDELLAPAIGVKRSQRTDDSLSSSYSMLSSEPSLSGSSLTPSTSIDSSMGVSLSETTLSPPSLETADGASLKIPVKEKTYMKNKNGKTRKGVTVWFLSDWLGFQNPFEREGFEGLEFKSDGRALAKDTIELTDADFALHNLVQRTQSAPQVGSNPIASVLAPVPSPLTSASKTVQWSSEKLAGGVSPLVAIAESNEQATGVDRASSPIMAGSVSGSLLETSSAIATGNSLPAVARASLYGGTIRRARSLSAASLAVETEDGMSSDGSDEEDDFEAHGNDEDAFDRDEEDDARRFSWTGGSFGSDVDEDEDAEGDFDEEDTEQASTVLNTPKSTASALDVSVADAKGSQDAGDISSTPMGWEDFSPFRAPSPNDTLTSAAINHRRSPSKDEFSLGVSQLEPPALIFTSPAEDVMGSAAIDMELDLVTSTSPFTPYPDSQSVQAGERHELESEILSASASARQSPSPSVFDSFAPDVAAETALPSPPSSSASPPPPRSRRPTLRIAIDSDFSNLDISSQNGDSRRFAEDDLSDLLVGPEGAMLDELAAAFGNEGDLSDDDSFEITPYTPAPALTTPVMRVGSGSFFSTSPVLPRRASLPSPADSERPCSDDWRRKASFPLAKMAYHRLPRTPATHALLPTPPSSINLARSSHSSFTSGWSTPAEEIEAFLVPGGAVSPTPCGLQLPEMETERVIEVVAAQPSATCTPVVETKVVATTPVPRPTHLFQQEVIVSTIQPTQPQVHATFIDGIPIYVVPLPNSPRLMRTLDTDYVHLQSLIGCAKVMIPPAEFERAVTGLCPGLVQVFPSPSVPPALCGAWVALADAKKLVQHRCLALPSQAIENTIFAESQILFQLFPESLFAACQARRAQGLGPVGLGMHVVHPMAPQQGAHNLRPQSDAQLKIRQFPVPVPRIQTAPMAMHSPFIPSPAPSVSSLSSKQRAASPIAPPLSPIGSSPLSSLASSPTLSISFPHAATNTSNDLVSPLSTVSSSSALADVAPPEVSNEPPVKRGPGRPRKHPRPEDEVNGGEPPVKRPRGRPKKVVLDADGMPIVPTPAPAKPLRKLPSKASNARTTRAASARVADDVLNERDPHAELEAVA